MASETIFFTGGGGFLGRYLLSHYIARGDTLYLLEQGKFVERLKEYLDQTVTDAQARQRLRIVEGTITEPNMGLTGSLLKEVQERTTKVIHLAALYNLSVPRDVAYLVNVEGTRNVLDFMETMPNVQSFGYVSTVAVSGDYKGLFTEDDFDKGQGFQNHYNETKFLAEKLVRERWQEIPTVIVRPGYVVGHSKTGAIEKIDGPYYGFIMLARHMHLIMPNSPTVKFHVVPVDYVTDAMFALFEDPSATGQAYHLTDPNPLTYNEFFDLACREMGRMKPLLRVKPSLMKPLIRLPFMEKLTGVPYDAFEYVDHPIDYDVSKALAKLTPKGIRCPSVPEYIHVMVKYFMENYHNPRIRKGDWKSSTT